LPLAEIGGARVYADLTTPLGLDLYRYGFCPVEARLLQKLLHPGDVFVDGGANIGLLSLVAAGAVGPTGRVLACEPSPGTMALLRANREANEFATLDLHEVALSDYSGYARLMVFEAGSGLSSFAPEHDGGREVEVVVATLDTLTQDLGRKVAVVKLDIEGAEAQALRGAHALVERDEPVFLVELEPGHLARQGASVAEVRDALEPRGYKAYALTQAAQLMTLSSDWRPSDPRTPNVLLAPPSQSARLARAGG
jgi:FkbM family methyltransferase